MKWDNIYSKNDYIYGTKPNDFLRENVSHLKSGNVLCVAEGEGRNAVFLAQQGFQVTAVDSSIVGLEKAQRLAAKNRVEITTIQSDLNDFDFGIERWDNVISIFCHLPPELRRKVHQKIEESLIPEGMLLLEAFTPKQLDFASGGPSQEQRLMSLMQLEQDFVRLRIIHSQELERDIAEGERHKGRSAVVQIIAQMIAVN